MVLQGFQSCLMCYVHFTSFIVSTTFLRTHILFSFSSPFFQWNLWYGLVAEISRSRKISAQPSSIDWSSRNSWTRCDEFLPRLIGHDNFTKPTPL